MRADGAEPIRMVAECSERKRSRSNASHTVQSTLLADWIPHHTAWAPLLCGVHCDRACCRTAVSPFTPLRRDCQSFSAESDYFRTPITFPSHLVAPQWLPMSFRTGSYKIGKLTSSC